MRAKDVLGKSGEQAAAEYLEASGLRIGTPALATRGLQAEGFSEVGRILALALTPAYKSRAEELAERVAAIVDRHPLYEGLASPAAV